jgi:capsule polysaccharide export protein KpsE/RkpR
LTPPKQSALPVIDRPEFEQSRELVNGSYSTHEDWLRLLWEKRRFLARATVRGVVVAVIIALLIPNRYSSTVKLMPPEQSSASGLAMLAAMVGKTGLGPTMTGGLGGLAGDLLGMKSSGAVFVDVLRSRSVQDRLIDRFDLRKVYRHKYYQDSRKDLTRFTEVSEDRKSGVLTITVTDRDKRRAQEMAQAYIQELDRMVALVSTSAARRERIFLEQRLQEVKHDLDTAANQFAEYSSKNTVLDATSQTKAMVESGAVLQGQLIAAQSELEGLEQIYTANNVRVRALKARVEELRSQLEKMGGNEVGNSTTSSAQGTQSDQLYPSLRKLPLLGVRWFELYRENRIQETVYELLTQAYELAKIQEAKEIPTVKVLDPANWPEKKSSPHRALLVILGTFLAFTAAVVWVLGNAAWLHMDPRHPRKQLGQEILDKFVASWSPRLSRSRALLTMRFWRNGNRSHQS